MEKFTGILGIISLFIAGIWAQESVSVDQTQISKKSGESVTLTCIGSSSKLDFYIKNRVAWEFVHMNGNVYPLTEGFYKTTNGQDYAEEKFRSGHFDINYTSGDVYKFVFTINAIANEDNGVYRCALLDPASVVQDSKNVTLTVVNPVEKVTLEIHDPSTHAVLAKKTRPAGENDPAVSLKPGNYMVKCVAKGSNPAPTVQVLYNDQPAGYSPLSTSKDVSNNRVQFTSTYSVPSYTFDASGMEQYLTCAANIPGNYFTQKEAGIKMMVKVDKPDIMCAPTAAMLGNRYVKIECNITAPGGGLQCDMVKWVIGNTDEMINSNEKWGSEDHKYDIMVSTCENVAEKLDVILDIYHTKQAHFDTIFYLSYGMGDNAHRVPVQLEQKPGSSNLITPFSMFIYLAIAFVTRQAMQRF